MHEYVAHTETKAGLVLKIIADQDARNPREEFDHAARMVCSHRSYDLGDSHDWDLSGPDFLAFLKKENAIYLPLYLYDHSGITMSCGSFSCPWDSGQVGWIYMTPAMIRENFMVKKITKKIKERAYELMRGEVSEYDDYLTGNVYGFVIETAPDEDADGDEIDGTGGEVLDSCWGFYGDPTGYVLHEAQGMLESLIVDRIPEPGAWPENTMTTAKRF